MINMVDFCSKSRSNLCVSKFVCYWMLVCFWISCYSRVHKCICLRIYWHASSHIYTYFRCLSVRMHGTQEECEKRRVDEGRGNESLQSQFLFLSNFVIGELFVVVVVVVVLNMKCLFCGEFSWVMMKMTAIKIIITLPFLCGMKFIGR